MDFRPVTLALALTGTAGAQDLLPSLDPRVLGGSVLSLAVMVAFIVQFVKKQFDRQGVKPRWWVTLAVALLVSEGLAALLFYSGYGARFGEAPPPWGWILFGLVAAASGAGGRDLLMSFAERGKTDVTVASGPATPEPAAPVTPAPLAVPPTITIVRPGDVPGLEEGPR